MLKSAIVIEREWSIFAGDPDFKSYAKILPVTLHTPGT